MIELIVESSDRIECTRVMSEEARRLAKVLNLQQWITQPSVGANLAYTTFYAEVGHA